MIDPATHWKTFVEEPHRDWTWSILERGYGEPHRRYHTLSHIAACLDLMFETWLVDKLEVAGVPRIALSLAILWHDVVYIPGDTRNEILSAKLFAAISDLVVIDGPLVDLVCPAIVATRTHKLGHASSRSATNGTRLVAKALIDIDLSILAAPQDTYDAYVKATREEYARVPDEAWRVGRKHFLEDMIARECIFSIEFLGDEYETRASENMTRELRQFESP